jgi:hypothetical protein
MPPDIVKVPVIQAIHEGDGGMLAERSGSLQSPVNRGGCDWDPLEYTAHFFLGRPFETSTGDTETPPSPPLLRSFPSPSPVKKWAVTD